MDWRLLQSNGHYRRIMEAQLVVHDHSAFLITPRNRLLFEQRTIAPGKTSLFPLMPRPEAYVSEAIPSGFGSA